MPKLPNLPLPPDGEPVSDLDVRVAADAVQRLNQDLMGAARSLKFREARFLVDAYYTLQSYRIRSDNQIRSMSEEGEPNSVLQWLAKNTFVLEGQVQRALKTFANEHAIGRWAMSITGVGPVIAAGLLAHLDIHKAPTTGHFYNIAGLNPELKWLGKEGAKQAVNSAFNQKKIDEESLESFSRQYHRRSQTLMVPVANVSYRLPSVQEIRETFDWDPTVDIEGFFADAQGVTEESLKDFVDMEPIILDRRRQRGLRVDDLLIAEENQGADVTWRLPTKAELIAKMARVPWNRKLKVLTWKIGKSFVMQRASKNDDYGRLYERRKSYEMEKNERLEYQEQARELLPYYVNNTIARSYYQKGQLPPGHIDARARRYAVKIFLSHFHEVWYWQTFNMAPPNPYALEFGEKLGLNENSSTTFGRGRHAHYIPVPKYDLPYRKEPTR